VPAQRFAQSLARAQASAAVPISEITVRAGDTLSALVGRHLRTVGAQPALNPAQLNQLAVGVAQDNGIANAHWIRPGQVIDVSAVEARAAALSRVGPQLAQAQSAPVPTAPMAWTAAGVVPATGSNRALGAATGALPGAATGAARSTGSAAGDFLVRHAAAANKTQDASGIPAQFMLAQAALETGWGRREIKAADGRNSFNLFGIRAGANWRGPSVEVMTTEYVKGVPERMVGRFRAYSSYEESFADYARLISQSPRYAQVMQNTGDPVAFASSLQRAGYATGPRYASALASVIEATGRLRATVPQVQVAMAGGMQAPPVFAAASPLPAAQELQLRWSPIAPMPTSALAKAAAARAMRPELYASVDLPAGP
jgi:flagellar rod assembly protein/muramidase FlgJ